jgi:hypothetical protein
MLSSHGQPLFGNNTAQSYDGTLMIVFLHPLCFKHLDLVNNAEITIYVAL